MRNLFLLIILLAVHPLSAQKDSSTFHPKNVIFGEAGGNALGYSINYGRIFWGEKMSACMIRAGFGFLPYAEGNEYQVPVEASLLIGKKRHFLELGAGLSIFSHVIFPHISPGGQSMDITTYTKRINGVNGCARIGYCFMPLYRNNLMFRVAFTPLFTDGYYEYREIKPWAGASIGWAF